MIFVFEKTGTYHSYGNVIGGWRFGGRKLKITVTP